MWTIILRERDAQIIVRFYAPVHPHRRYCEAICFPYGVHVCVFCVCAADASETELRFYNNCKSYVMVSREAKTVRTVLVPMPCLENVHSMFLLIESHVSLPPTMNAQLQEHPDEGEQDYYGVPFVALQECHRQEDAAMDADFPFLDKPGIDADSCDIAGVWECQGVQQSGDVDGPVSTAFGEGNVTIFDVSEHTFSASNGASPMSMSICKTEPWSEPSAPTASCVQTKLSGHSYLHFNNGCSQLMLTAITSVVEPKDASRDPYFEDPVVRAAECTKIE